MKNEKNAEPINILLVEDSPTQAEELKYLLERHGYRVIVAENGRQALARFNEEKPSLVISDIIMPEMNGFELCKQIKSDDNDQDIPVILLTSLSSSEDVLEGLACGADNFITKPYNEEYLISSVEKILTNKKLRKSERVRIGVEILFGGQKRFITADQQQMLTLLISTYEAAVQRNSELLHAQDELCSMNERLEKLVEERTAALSAEIAERKQAEKTLRESEERFRSIFDLSTVGQSLIATDGRYLKVNRAFASMLGYTIEEMQQAALTNLTHPDDIAISRECIRSLLANERSSFRMEKRYLHRNGKPVWADVSTVLLRDNNGEPIYFITSIMDITERRQLEEQLHQAVKMEAIGRLAGGVAHDFNNVLVVMLSYSEFIMTALNENDPLREDAKEIHQAAERGAALTRQLLAFSRREVIKPTILNVNNIITNLNSMLKRIIGEDIELEIVMEDNLATARADAGQMEQVIVNLAVNARDAMPNGGKLLVETKNVYLDQEYSNGHLFVTPGAYIMFAVSDNGCGMDTETLTKIFEPFFTTKEKGKGTGLGLSVVYGMVKQNNGYIIAYSEPGKGTTFKIYLPRVEGATDVIHESKIATDNLRGNETVLLVEDDDAVRNITSRILKLNGYRVLEASHSEEALIISERYKEPIHLLLTDVIMPQMSGKELADKLSKIFQNLKVVYMSGYTDNAIGQHGVLDNDIVFLQKPFTTMGLLTIVREALDKDCITPP